MDEETLTESEQALAETALESDSSDEFAAIRAHYESGVALTDDEMDKIADLAVGYLKSILELFGETHCSIDEYDGDNGDLILDVNGGDLAVLIGRHGRTLDALQMVLSSLMSSKIRFYYPITVDIESYKSRRRHKIEEIARNAADRVRRQGGKVSLAPMNAYERRLVHLTLHDQDDLVTHSEGEEPERHVVIALAE